MKKYIFKNFKNKTSQAISWKNLKFIIKQNTSWIYWIWTVSFNMCIKEMGGKNMPIPSPALPSPHL